MNKLDDVTINQGRRRCSSGNDELAYRQRRIIFAAFGRRENDSGVVVSLCERSRRDEVGLSLSLRSGECCDKVLSFPVPSAQRRQA